MGTNESHLIHYVLLKGLASHVQSKNRPSRTSARSKCSRRPFRVPGGAVFTRGLTFSSPVSIRLHHSASPFR